MELCPIKVLFLDFFSFLTLGYLLKNYYCCTAAKARVDCKKLKFTTTLTSLSVHGELWGSSTSSAKNVWSNATLAYHINQDFFCLLLSAPAFKCGPQFFFCNLHFLQFFTFLFSHFFKIHSKWIMVLKTAAEEFPIKIGKLVYLVNFSSDLEKEGRCLSIESFFEWIRQNFPSGSK